MDPAFAVRLAKSRHTMQHLIPPHGFRTKSLRFILNSEPAYISPMHFAPSKLSQKLVLSQKSKCTRPQIALLIHVPQTQAIVPLINLLHSMKSPKHNHIGKHLNSNHYSILTEYISTPLPFLTLQNSIEKLPPRNNPTGVNTCQNISFLQTPIYNSSSRALIAIHPISTIYSQHITF